ncbi:MAG TPA: RAMP superfamily CRISPR-associated protein [Candidatus Pacearchaeota archaeon]|nr:RAMP superfamily CRISPR-associated protein [Candidatus Pacearchaeota archaeon]
MTHDYFLNNFQNKKDKKTFNKRDQDLQNNKLKYKKPEDKYKLWLEKQFIIPLAREKNSTRNNIEKIIVDFYPQQQDLESLPPNSTLIEISFTLKKPYTSKDEGEFNVIDNKIFENPIVRDKFTGLPMVKPTTWKGHLRFAAERVECDKERKKIIIKRLFGSEPEEKENPLKGRLYFFPTFFNKEAEKEVITPLKRDTRTPARGPIPFEVMKPSKEGKFYLLYFPYPKGDNYQESQVDEDLEFLSKSLELMFYSYGFSAKKTSGFGVIERLKENNVDVYPSEKKDKFSNLYNNLENNSQE